MQRSELISFFTDQQRFFDQLAMILNGYCKELDQHQLLNECHSMVLIARKSCSEITLMLSVFTNSNEHINGQIQKFIFDNNQINTQLTLLNLLSSELFPEKLIRLIPEDHLFLDAEITSPDKDLVEIAANTKSLSLPLPGAGAGAGTAAAPASLSTPSLPTDHKESSDVDNESESSKRKQPSGDEDNSLKSNSDNQPSFFKTSAKNGKRLLPTAEEKRIRHNANERLRRANDRKKRTEAAIELEHLKTENIRLTAKNTELQKKVLELEEQIHQLKNKPRRSNSEELSFLTHRGIGPSQS